MIELKMIELKMIELKMIELKMNQMSPMLRQQQQLATIGSARGGR